ncbi:GNAT family N-acetyltransferase [soil metagenome]
MMHESLRPDWVCDPQQFRSHQDKQGAEFQVCSYHPDARESLQSFYEKFEPKRAAQGLPPTGADRIARWLEIVLGQGIHLLACRDGGLIGHALLMPTKTEGAAEYAVFLRIDMRSRGVGTEFNRAALDAAREKGLYRIWLSVAPHNRAAIRSYEKVGFRFVPNTIYSPEAEMQIEL